MTTASSDWDNEWQEIPGPEAILIGVVQNPKLLPLQGKTLAEVAKIQNKDPMDALFDLLIEDNAATEVAVFGMSEPDVSLALQQPWVSFDNDSSGASPDGILGQEHPHPRAYGTFPRILRKYVREEKKLSLEDAIRKFSALPAQRMRLTDRGVLKAGMWADIVLFDPVDHPRSRNVRKSQPAVAGNGVCPGQRSFGYRSGQDDGSIAGESLARSGICALAHILRRLSRIIMAPSRLFLGQSDFV